MSFGDFILGRLRQRQEPYRNRALLDLAHKVTQCTHCAHIAHEGCEPAHQNGIAAGKGQGVKGQDNRHAALCHTCHRWLDSGTGRDPLDLYDATRADKASMWIRAHLLTFDFYWRMGWIKVR